MSEDREALLRARSKWQHRGRERPPFATAPGPGEESVWDYPRPPVLVREGRHVRVVLTGDVILADSTRCLRVLETASPPTFYVPPADVRFDLLEPTEGGSLCEWKGQATYWSLLSNSSRRVAWSYPRPFPEFADLVDYLAFYPAAVACWVDDRRVTAQPGGFYGGWVTPEVVGPFKGEPGTELW